LMWILKYEQGHVCYREYYLFTLRGRALLSGLRDMSLI
jgi:hypothetical protein